MSGGSIIDFLQVIIFRRIYEGKSLAACVFNVYMQTARFRRSARHRIWNNSATKL